MKLLLEIITPARAEELLRLNSKNRRVNPTVVHQYATLMQANKWHENGDPIRVSTEEILLDGQHRLLALIRAGATLKMPVITGLRPDVFATIDRQFSRTPAQIFALAEVANAGVISRLCRTLVDYEAGRIGLALTSGGGRRSGITPEELLEYYRVHENELQQAARHGDVYQRSTAFFSCSEWAFLHVVLTRTGRAQEAHAFLEQLVGGAGLTEKDVVLMVRNLLFRSMTSISKLTAGTKMTYVLLAWNRVRTNRRTGMVKVTPETSFPTPL